jgi:nucleoside 2-deoxyribosyltransferase
MKKIYLAGPIDDVNSDQRDNWRTDVKLAFGTPPYYEWIECVDPAHRVFTHKDFDSNPGLIKEIVTLDKIDITQSDILLANLTLLEKVRVVGTLMEIPYAFDKGKYVIVIMDKKVPLSPWIAYHSHKVVYSVEEAINWIKGL